MTVPDPDREGRDGDGPGTPDQEPGSPLDIDTAFAAIVAGWGDDDDTPGSWPAEEDLGTPKHRQDGDPAAGGAPAGPVGKALDAEPGAPERNPVAPLVPNLDPGPSQAERDLEERFIPPDPPPIPRGDLVSRLAWAGALGGPLFLLIAAMVWRSAPQLLVLGAVAAFVAGFVTLVVRLPQHHDDDGDDGAVV